MHRDGDLQRERELAGYRAGSPWPGEDGGPSRRQSPRIIDGVGRGWNLAQGGALELTATRAVSGGQVSYTPSASAISPDLPSTDLRARLTSALTVSDRGPSRPERGCDRCCARRILRDPDGGFDR